MPARACADLTQARNSSCCLIAQAILPKSLLIPKKLHVGQILVLFFPLGKKHCGFLITFMLSIKRD